MKTRFIPRYLAPLLLCGTALADTHTWTGLGGDGNWTNIANWYANYRPYDGEASISLVFPNGASRPTSTCNIAGLSVGDIILNGSGYSLNGNSPITLIGAGNSLYSAGVNNIFGIPLVLASVNLNFGQGPGASLRMTNVISGSGGFKKIGKGDLYLEGISDNTFTGSTTVLGGTLHLKKDSTRACFSGPLIIGDTAGNAVGGGLPDSIVMMEGEQQMAFGTPVTVNPDGKFALGTHSAAISSLTMVGNGLIDSTGTAATLTIFGNIICAVNPMAPTVITYATINPNLSLGGATRTITTDSDLSLAGNISSGGGNAGIIKNGLQNLSILGNCTYTGDTIINQGWLTIYGTSPASNIYMKPGTEITGSATVGAVQCIGTVLRPSIDNPPGAPPVNLTTKNVSLDKDSTFDLFIDDAMVGTQSLLTVLGTVNLGGCELKSEIEFSAIVNPAVGSELRIINNDLADPVVGSFKDLPEGASFKFSGRRWTITYKGGDGNDVVLTLASGQLPFSLDKIALGSGSGGFSTVLTGNGTPGITYLCQSSPDLNVWTDMGLVGNNNGNLIRFANHFPSNPKYFYRFVQPGGGPGKK